VRFRSSELSRDLGATHRGRDVSISSVSIDSRTCERGSLFVPVVYERDGHDFIPDAVRNGAVAFLTHRSVPDGIEAAALEVADTGEALLQLGSMARRRLTDRVVAVTGSVGKSSVKDMTGAVLARRWRTLVSPGNYNNELGLPLTLANAEEDAEALMLEMGARGIGHIAQLCEVARPAVGIVTMVAAVHTEVFGSIDEVARGKGELMEALPENGFAVLNADDPRVMAMAARTRASVVTFGAEDAEVRAEEVTADEQLRARFALASPWGRASVVLAAHGMHNVTNALAAAGAGLALGIGPEEVAAGLSEAQLSHWRMEVATGPSGEVIINDAYNASPVSVDAALRTAAGLPGRRHLAVLGAMAELGPEGPAEHLRMGALAAELGIQVLAVGTDQYGPSPVSDWEAALDALGRLQPALGEGDVVLVKASRVAGLERLAAALLG
jgi:UDP-N-acetylmuramoyl-tripeptide--D-alanyl-D-alanine ligase